VLLCAIDECGGVEHGRCVTSHDCIVFRVRYWFRARLFNWACIFLVYISHIHKHTFILPRSITFWLASLNILGE
jgi:hypothetical protein